MRIEHDRRHLTRARKLLARRLISALSERDLVAEAQLARRLLDFITSNTVVRLLRSAPLGDSLEWLARLLHLHGERQRIRQCQDRVLAKVRGVSVDRAVLEENPQTHSTVGAVDHFIDPATLVRHPRRS